MFVGHAGLALLAGSRRASPPLPVLLAAAYGPDWLELGPRLLSWAPARVAVVTHSLAATAVAGVLAALAWWLVRRDRTGAVLVALAWWSHWPADFATALKPTWPGGPRVGLGLYSHGAADLLLESALVLAGWLACRRWRRPSRLRAVATPALLILLQLAFVNQERLALGDWKNRALEGIVDGVR